MNARTTVSKLAALLSLTAVSMIVGCAAQTDGMPGDESTGTSESALTTPTSLPGPVTCDAKTSCSFTALGWYLQNVNTTTPVPTVTQVPGCTQVYEFKEQRLGIVSNGLDYDVAYCIESAAVDLWVSHASGWPGAAGGAGFATESSTQRALPAAANGYTYVAFTMYAGIKCPGGCPLPAAPAR